jgi:hypothetical protein
VEIKSEWRYIGVPPHFFMPRWWSSGTLSFLPYNLSDLALTLPFLHFIQFLFSLYMLHGSHPLLSLPLQTRDVCVPGELQLHTTWLPSIRNKAGKALLN